MPEPSAEHRRRGVLVAGGQRVEVDLCTSRAHARLATRLVHWVTGWVGYCDQCAEHMRRCGEALGAHVEVVDHHVLEEPATRRAMEVR